MAGPYNFESQPKFARNLVLSANTQAAWNTAVPSAALTYRQRFDGAAILERTITRRSDIDYAGKGTAFATNGQITSYDTKFTGLKHECTSWLAGWLCSLLMGKETVTGGIPLTLASIAGALTVSDSSALVYGTLSGLGADGITPWSMILSGSTLAAILTLFNTTHTAYGITASSGESGKQLTFAAAGGDTGSPTLVGTNLSYRLPTGPYSHTFTFDESTRTAQETTLYVEDTDDVHYTVPDMCVGDVTFTIKDIGAVIAEASLMGTGYMTAGTIETLPDPPSETYLLNSDAQLMFGPVGSTAPFIGRLMEATIKLDNQLVVHKAPGGGLYGIYVRKGNPKFSMSCTVAAAATDDIYTLFLNDTASDFELAIDSAVDTGMTVSIPAMHLKTTKLGLDGDMIIWQIETDESTNYQASGVPPVTITVTNDVAAYLLPYSD